MVRILHLVAKSIALAFSFGVFSLLCLAGCGGSQEHPHTTQNANNTDDKVALVQPAQQTPEEIELQAERAKLSPEDRRLVAAQEFCAISNDEKLGAMGPPIKVMVNDQPVFLCCKGCEKRALANPEKTLAKVAELKAKVKAGADK